MLPPINLVSIVFLALGSCVQAVNHGDTYILEASGRSTASSTRLISLPIVHRVKARSSVTQVQTVQRSTLGTSDTARRGISGVPATNQLVEYIATVRPQQRLPLYLCSY